MNSVDGAPNATILAEGATTIVPTKTNTCNSVSAETTKSKHVTSSTIKRTVDYATDEFHASDKNEQNVVNVEGQPHQHEEQQQHEAESVILTTNSETKTSEPAIITDTMSNTEIASCETETADETAIAEETETQTTPNATVTAAIIKNAESSDVQMINQTTPESKSKHSDEKRDPANVASHTKNAATVPSDTVDDVSTAPDSENAIDNSTVIDNTIETSSKSQIKLTAEGDNYLHNEMKLCRCCGKPNVTLYNLFPNGQIGDSLYEQNEDQDENTVQKNDDANAVETKSAELEKQIAQIDDKKQDSHCAPADNAECVAAIEHKTGINAVDPSSITSPNKEATKTSSLSKNECKATGNTPKNCYRNIVASITAAAAATTSGNKTTSLISDAAPTCLGINDPVVAATNGGKTGDAGSGERQTANSSIARVKKSTIDDYVATAAAPHHANANSNTDAQGQASDNMENILQEMQIWQLWIKSNDGLPQRICPKCTAQFYIIHKFRRKCLKVQIRLRSLLNKTNSWEYEELLARATAELTEEQQQQQSQQQQQISAQGKPKSSSSSKSPSKPNTNNFQRRRDQETQTTDELPETTTTTMTKTTALSVNLPPVLDIGNDLIKDNYNKSAHLLMVGPELGANNADNLVSSNNNNNSRKSKLSAVRAVTASPKKTARTTTTTSSIVISETLQANHPLLGDELTNTKIPSISDLTSLDFEEALDSSRNERSDVDQESLLATHIIFKPALSIVSPTMPARRKYTRRKPNGHQTTSNELSFSANVMVNEERCEDNCLTAAAAVVNDGDGNGDEVKNEALAWARAQQAELEVAAMSAEATVTVNTASSTKHTESCERPVKRAREQGGGAEYVQYNDACDREKGEGDQRETEAEIASAAVFMDTRHAYFTANEDDATTAAANSCDAHILIGGCYGGGNVVKAISDEATNAMLLTSWHSEVADDLLRPAVGNSIAAIAMNADDDAWMRLERQQEKPISGQAVAITMGWNPTSRAMVGATEVMAGSAVTQALANDVQSSKQTLEASEISNLPILAATKQTTTCNNETVKDDDAAALQIIVSETDAAKVVAAAAIEDNNKAVITGNTLKSSLNWSFSMRNANDVSKDKGYFGRNEHHLPTDERRFAVENNVAVTDVDGDDVKGVETLMATVELRPQTTQTLKTTTAEQTQGTTNNRTIKSDAATTTHSEEMLLRLREIETQTDLEISTSNDAFPSSASSAFVTKAALKAYSTSPKCRSFARRHMQHKFRRTFKGPIAQLLACSPASTSAAAAAFTAMHYKKKQLRRSIGFTHLISERQNDATPASAAITPSTDTTTSSSSNGVVEEGNAPPPQPTFSYYATARRGRRRLKWRERSRLPYFDKHMHQHVNLTEVEGSATINNDVQGDNKTSQATATTQELPSCFVRLRRLENSELSDKPTTTLAETKENIEQVEQNTSDKSTTDVHMSDAATHLEGEFEAVTVIGSHGDEGSTRITLKRKLPVEEIERLSSTRSPWRTKAEMKESLQQQAALDKAKAAEETDDQLTLYTQELAKNTGSYTETEKTEMSFTETCATDGDSAGTTSCLERRSKRIKKRRKMWEESNKTNVTTASSDGGKVMPIILKLVQEKRPEGCVSCTPKSETTSTAAQIVRGALVSKMTAARYHVVGAGSIPQPQGDELNAVVPQKRRRHRPKRTCCRDGCMTDDTTEDDSATSVGRSYQTSRLLPPPSIGQFKGGKMIINNVNILSAKNCVESTKENCDNNKKELLSASDVSTTTEAMTVAQTSSNSKTNKMSLPSQLVPLLPLLPALLPSSSLAQTQKMDDASQQQLSPTNAAPTTPMSLKTFSSLVSTSSKAVLHTSPVKSAVTLPPTKNPVPSSPTITAKEAVLPSAKPTLSSKVANPVSVLLRNQLIVRVPLSALSAEFKRKFCTATTSAQNTPIKAVPAVSTENVLASVSPKKTTSPQATTRTQETAISHGKMMACGVENTAHVEHSNKKHYGNKDNSCTDGNNTSKSVTAVSLDTTAATTITSSTKATIETAQLSTETVGDKRTQSAAGGDNNTSKCNSQNAVQAKDMNTQFMRYTGSVGGGSSRYESEQSDFMGFSDGTGSSPNGHRGCSANSNSNSNNNVYNTTTTNLHDFISEIAPALADDESEAPQANELQATLPTGEVTAALLAEAEAEAETRSPLQATSSHTPVHAEASQRTQLLSETNLSEMQDVETTLSGILNEMQDQHIYTPVSSSADDFFAQSVYSPLSEPPATPTQSIYAESPLGGMGSVGSSSMAGGGGSLSVASSPYVQHIHMEPGSVSSGQMSEPSPLPAPMSVGPSPHHHPHHQQQQQAAVGYGKQYANKYGECFTEDSTQSELIGFQNDIPCFENIELVATAAKTASSSPASCHNGQSAHEVEMTQSGRISAVPVATVAAMPIEVDPNCKVVDAEASPVQYIAVAQSSEANANIELVCTTEAQANDLATSDGTEGIAGKEYAVDNATLAQLLNDFEATEREALRREEEEERLRKQKEIEDDQQPQLVQAHLVEQQLMEQQLVQVEVVQTQQGIQQQLPQDEVLLQRQQHHRDDDILKHQQLLQQQKEQDQLLRQQMLEQQQQDQLLQQQHLMDQHELLEQQRLQQHHHKQLYDQQRKQQSQRPHIYNQTIVAAPKHTPPGRSSQQQKQHYITLPPSCAYEAAQMQLAQAADPIQPMHNLGMGVNLYAHNIGPGQEIQWTSSADLTSLSPTFIEAPGAGGGTTTYYINASDLYQPNVIAAQEQQRLPSLHHHHQPQQHQMREQQLHALELEKCSMIDANENYIEGMPDGEVTIQRQSCQQQQQQQQQQIMIVIPQDYGTSGAGSATAQLYTTTGTPDQAGTTYHLSQAPQTVIMQHGQPQALQMSGVNLSPQFITAQSSQRTGHHTPSPRHLHHYQLHNAATPPIRPANTLGRPLRCASTPSATNYQHRQQQPTQLIQHHPHQLQMQQRQQQLLQQQQQMQQHQQSDSPKMRMVQHLRARQQALQQQQQQQQQQLVQPHSHVQSRPQPQAAVTAATTGETPSQKVNLVCRFCHKRPKFTSNLDYSNHIIAMHPVETPFNCPYCPMHFTRRVKREKHIVEEHGAHRFQCAQCGQSFCTQRTLDQHLQRAHALDPTTQSAQSTQAQTAAGGQRLRQPRQIAPSAKTTQHTTSEQQIQQRRKCYLQQRPTWLDRRNRTAATIASAASTASAASNSQTSMVRVEDVHLQVCDDAAKGKKSIDLQLDTTQLTAESTTKITNERANSGSTPSSSGNKPQRILCCPDCDDPFNEEHSHAQPSGEVQSHEQQQQQLELQQQQQQEQQEVQQEQQQQQQLIEPHEQFDPQEDEEEEADNEQQLQQQPQQREQQLSKPLAKSAHVTLPSPEQTEPDSTSSTNNTAILRQFRKRRASSKYAGMAALLAAGNSNGGSGSSSSALLAAATAAGNPNATEDELLLMERVLRNSHNCLFCDARFTNDIALRKHHQLAHSNQASMPFVCSICKRGFRMRTALQRHMETHDSEGRPYECTLCHVRFPRPSQLTLHKLTVHFLRKPHACGVCGKQFGTESALKTHSTFHQAPSVECDVCKRKFYLKKDLRKHKRLHTGERFYKCDFCDAAFMHYSRLMGHMKTHLPLGVSISEEDVIQLPQRQQQQLDQQQEFEEEEEMTATEEQEQQPQIEIEPPQQEECEQQQQQELEQLLENEPQDIAEPQTAEPQAGDDHDNDDDEDNAAANNEDVTATMLNAKRPRQMPELDEGEANNAEAEMQIHEEQRRQHEEQQQEQAQQHEEQAQAEQEQKQADEHYAQNANELMLAAGSCSPSTTTDISSYAGGADTKHVSHISTTSNATITTTSSTSYATSASGNSLVNDSESVNGCSSSAK